MLIFEFSKTNCPTQLWGGRNMILRTQLSTWVGAFSIHFKDLLISNRLTVKTYRLLDVTREIDEGPYSNSTVVARNGYFTLIKKLFATLCDIFRSHTWFSGLFVTSVAEKYFAVNAKKYFAVNAVDLGSDVCRWRRYCIPFISRDTSETPLMRIDHDYGVEAKSGDMCDKKFC